MPRAVLKITPVDNQSSRYLPEFDASKYLIGDDAITPVTHKIDNSDYVVGVFSFDSCTIRLMNLNGIFTVGEHGSIFTSTRNKSLIKIYFQDDAKNDHLLFKGLLADESTKENILNETVEFIAISIDSELHSKIFASVQFTRWNINEQFFPEEFRQYTPVSLTNPEDDLDLIPNLGALPDDFTGYPILSQPFYGYLSYPKVSDLILHILRVLQAETIPFESRIIDLDINPDNINFDYDFTPSGVKEDEQSNFKKDYVRDNPIEINLITDREKFFREKPLSHFLNTWLISTNSFAHVKLDENSNELIIRPRVEPDVTPKRNFFGPYDTNARKPIILAIKNYNSGLQRVINQITAKYTAAPLQTKEEDVIEPGSNPPKVTGQRVIRFFDFRKGTTTLTHQVKDTESIERYGLKVKEIDLTYLFTQYYQETDNGQNPELSRTFLFRRPFTDPLYSQDKFIRYHQSYNGEVIDNICKNLLEKYSIAKRELVIIVKTDDAWDLNVGDVVTISYEKKFEDAISGPSFYGEAEYDKNDYGQEYGSFSIKESTGFLIYGISHNLSNFTTELKLREYGYKTDDSSIAVPNTYGRAIYGKSRYG